MTTNDASIAGIAKGARQLLLLAIAVILYLTLSLLCLQFFSFLGYTDFLVLSEDSYRLSFFLTILIFLFCIYVIVRERKLFRISRDLISVKEKTHVLSNAVQILHSLLEVSAAISSQRELSAILNTITKRILDCFEADRSSIMLIDKASGSLRTFASHGAGADLARNALLRPGQGVAGWVMKTGKPLLLNGTVDPARFPGTPAKEMPIRSALCVPLKIKGKTVGVLNVNQLGAPRVFSEEHLRLIGIFANNAAGAIQNAVLSRERLRRIRLQTMFEQFHSPKVAHELVKQAQSASGFTKKREKKEITVLFADIRGFSDITNEVPLEELMDFLDAFYMAMTQAIFDNEGNVDKFIGDEVMAFFGAPNALENSAMNALNASTQMTALFSRVREEFARKNAHFENLGIGIGLHTGEVVVGNVGSSKRYEYTVIGNAVNLARRLCSSAESAHVVFTESVRKGVSGPDYSEPLGVRRFKGIPKPVIVYRWMGDAGMDAGKKIRR